MSDLNENNLRQRSFSASSSAVPASGRPGYINERSPDRSSKCRCGSCPKVPPHTLLGVSLEKPFTGCIDEQAKRNVAKRVACEYRLKEFSGMFERAALLIAKTHDHKDVAHHMASDHGLMQDHGSAAHSDVQQDHDLQHNASIDHEAGAWPNNERRGGKDALLQPYERQALSSEPQQGFWDQPRPFRTTCYMLFVAALVQGWNQTATNGVDRCWMDSLLGRYRTAISDAPDPCDDDRDSRLKYAVINAAPFLFAPLGCALADPLTEWLLGRRRALLCSAVLILAVSIGGAFSGHWWQLLIFRAFLGIGMGSKASVVPVFAAEIAPPHLRGTLIMNWQIFDALGIFFGFTANLIASTSASSSEPWRWQVASSCVPSFALLICVLLISWDSPRFLMQKEQAYQERYDGKKGTSDHQHPRDRSHSQVELQPSSPVRSRRRQTPGNQLWRTMRHGYGPNTAFEYQSKAFDTLVILRGSEFLAVKELLYTHLQLVMLQVDQSQRAKDDLDFQLKAGPGYFTKLGNLFSPKLTLHHAMAAAAVGMIGQQLCGINVLIFYSSRLLSAAGSRDGNTEYALYSRTPVWISWAIGLVNFLFGLPAYWWIETRGRRFLALITLPALSICMIVAAGCFSIEDDYTTARKVGVGVSSLLFTAFYSPGMGPVPFTVAAEVFPLDHRLVGMSVASMINFGLGGLIALGVPFVPRESVLLGVFAGANVLAFALIWLFMREIETTTESNKHNFTGYVRLEEIHQIYEPKHRDHIRFQKGRQRQAMLALWDFCRYFYRSRPFERKNEDYFHLWYTEQKQAEYELEERLNDEAQDPAARREGRSGVRAD